MECYGEWIQVDRVWSCLLNWNGACIISNHVFFKIDEDKQQFLNRWLPEKLSPNVRVIISTIESTVSHQTIRTFKSNPTEIVCGPLDKDSRKVNLNWFFLLFQKLQKDSMKEKNRQKGIGSIIKSNLSCFNVWNIYAILLCEDSLIQSFFILIEKLIAAAVCSVVGNCWEYLENIQQTTGRRTNQSSPRQKRI